MSEIEKQEAKGRKRNVQINIRISEAEAEQLRKKVEQSGMSQQEYILSCLTPQKWGVIFVLQMCKNVCKNLLIR